MFERSNLSLCALGLTACLMSGLAMADDEDATKVIRELKNGDDVEGLTSAYDYAVISFYKPSDEANVAVQEVFEKSHEYFNKMLSEQAWSHRQVGWFKVNIETEDELTMFDEPDQLVMTK